MTDDPYRWLLLATVLLTGSGCGSPSETPVDSSKSWSVTAWGRQFEILSEAEALVAGKVAVVHLHVTDLSDFSPSSTAGAELVLTANSNEEVFRVARPDRPGVYSFEVTPSEPGEAELRFRIDSEAGVEEIRGGTVRIGNVEQPGSLLRAPAPRGGSDGGAPLAFSKEQQWGSDFATQWVEQGRLPLSVAGFATLRPPAGGETIVTAPLDGVVKPAARGWPFVGLEVTRGSALLQVSPIVAADRSLVALEAELEALNSELATAAARGIRLQELLEIDATSEREVEESRTREKALRARLRAAERDLEAARSSRGGPPSDDHGILLAAPFSGVVADVDATSGAAVTSGDSLLRMVRTDVVWIEVAVAPRDVRRLVAGGVRGIVLEDPETEGIRIENGLSLVSVAPELSPRTGTVAVLLEVPRSVDLVLGTTVAAQILLTEEESGIVVPASAVVDDGGVAVVYLQLSGESFVRQSVEVVARQGDSVLVDGLVAGQRLVTRGGNAIRRSSLMAVGGGHGHVH